MRALRGDKRLLPILPLWCEQAVRFFFVGLVNTFVGYVFYATFVLLGLPAALALLCGNTLSVTFAFFSTGHFVYGQLGKRRIIRYVTMMVGLYLLNAALLETLLAHGLGKLVAQAALVPFMAALSFLIGRSWVFRPARA